MIEQGKVARILENNLIEVEINKSEACSSCGACILGSDPNAMKRTIVVSNIKSSKVGEMVNIEIDSKNFYQAFFLIFVLPLVSFIGSAWVLIRLGLSEGIAFAASLMIFLLSFLIARRYDKQFGENNYRIF